MKKIDISIDEVEQYIEDALETESNKYELITQQFSSPRSIRLMHSFIGISTELTEFLELVQKKPFDLVNLREEAGDVFWYVAIALDELKIDLRAFLDQVNSKLTTNQTVKEKLMFHFFKKSSFTSELMLASISSGTLLDMMKKYIYYVSDDPSVPKRTLELQKIENLLVAVFVSIVKMLDLNQFKVKETLVININKLHKKRYKSGKFSSQEATVRNLEQERRALEGKE